MSSDGFRGRCVGRARRQILTQAWQSLAELGRAWQSLNTKYQNTKYQIPNTKYQNTKYQIPDTSQHKSPPRPKFENVLFTFLNVLNIPLAVI